MINKVKMVSIFILLMEIFFIYIQYSYAQESEFIKKSGENFVLNGKFYYSIGANCYYLQNLSALGDTTKVNEIFIEAKQLGINTLRTWGFYDSSDSTNKAVIQYAPGVFNEEGLKALDFVLLKAREHSIRLIIPFVNNWEDYGGMNQYVCWYAGEKMEKVNSSIKGQKIVYGVGGRSYRVKFTDIITHDDFYKNSVIKEWYKNYVYKILTRINTYTNIAYRDDPVVMAWELANEPRSSDRTGEIVFEWMNEMASFIKEIDTNHLVGTGEEGFDVSNNTYFDVSKYPSWMFNGSAGISFSKNVAINDVDMAGIHFYHEAWNLNYNQINFWIHDHYRFSKLIKKPIYFGEVGVRKNKSQYYDYFFNKVLNNNISGILLWQLSYKGSPYLDPYSFNCPDNQEICILFQKYSDKFYQKIDRIVIIPDFNQLLHNYPNPFNKVTLITYEVEKPRLIILEVYNLLGQKVFDLVNHYHQAGEYKVIFDGSSFTSGIYYVLMRYSGGFSGLKTVLIR